MEKERDEPGYCDQAVAFPYLAPELWRLVEYNIVVLLCTHIIRGSISDIYTLIIALTQTSSMPLHGINLIHISLKPSVPNPAHTVVPVWGDDREKSRVLCVRLYPVDLNGTVKENTEAAGSFMRRRNFGGIGGCRGGGGMSVRCWGAGDSRGDGCRECKFDKDKDEDVDVEGLWWCAWFGGGCCDAMRGSNFARQVVVR